MMNRSDWRPKRQDDTQGQRQEDPGDADDESQHEAADIVRGTNSIPMGATLPKAPAMGPARNSQ
jgi:hypothetical protein